jgi:hypothetical protein
MERQNEFQPIVVTARLAKRKTDDGVLEVLDDLPLGRVYKVFPETAQLMPWRHRESGDVIERMSVWTIAEGSPNGGWFPIELLEVEWN